MESSETETTRFVDGHLSVQVTRIDLTPEQVEYFIFDLASGIHHASTIALRWGFKDEAELRAYLGSHLEIVMRVQHLKRQMESDQGTAERVKLKSQLAYEQVIPALASIAMNPMTPAKDRIEASKELRMSGAVGVTKEGSGGGGTQFSLTIVLPTGDKTITTVVDSGPVRELPEEDAA